MKIDFATLLQDYEPLIKSQIKRLHLTNNYEHYYQIGAVGLWKAYKNFDAEKGKFSTYAYHTVRGHLLMALRDEKKFTDHHLLQDEQTSGHFHIPAEQIKQEPTSVEELIPFHIHLSPREKLWIKEAIILDNTLSEIAKKHNVSTNTVSTWRKNALRKLRAHKNYFKTD